MVEILIEIVVQTWLLELALDLSETGDFSQF